MVGSGTRNARAISGGVNPPSQAKGERRPRLRRQDRVAGNEDEAQQIVADLIVEGFVEIRRCLFLKFQLVAELYVFAVKELIAPEGVDCPMLCRHHEPSTRLVGKA
jgi:hypothetical protein